jgi:hypothetical protein
MPLTIVKAVYRGHEGYAKSLCQYRAKIDIWCDRIAHPSRLSFGIENAFSSGAIGKDPQLVLVY